MLISEALAADVLARPGSCFLRFGVLAGSLTPASPITPQGARCVVQASAGGPF